MKKVLLTSESKGFLDRNTTFLLRRGFQLFTATEGAKALGLHQEQGFDIILADQKLDDMSGYTLCSRLNSAGHPKLPAVVIICQNSAENVRKATESGASTVLLKPVDPEKLLTTIIGFLDLQAVKSRRIALNVPVLCRASEAEFSCLSHDISNTGLLIESDQFNIGSLIACELTLPDSSHFKADGKVVRQAATSEGKNLCGIQFINPPLSSLRTVISYVVATATSAPDKVVPHYADQHCTYSPSLSNAGASMSRLR